MCSDNGKVLSWGHGGHGQLGHRSIENQGVPLVIEALAQENIVFITCGGSSSAAVTGKAIFLGTLNFIVFLGILPGLFTCFSNFQHCDCI